MKKLTLLTAFLFFLINIIGCNIDDENVSDVPQNIPVEENGANNQGDTNQPGESSFNFTHFDLDVDYSENQEFDVDYENELDSMEAEIKDDKANNNLKGDEAFAVLRPIFEKLTFDKNVPKEKVILEVVNAFNLGKDFQMFELEVRFSDGTNKEYKS